MILALLVGAAVAAVFGVLIGIPVLRLRGDYLAIVTLAFGEIIKNLSIFCMLVWMIKGFTLQQAQPIEAWIQAEKQIIKGALGFPALQPYIKILRIISS